METMDCVMYRLDHPAQNLTAIPTGIAGFDRNTVFLRKDELSLLGSRPGMGKTSIAVQIAQSVAQQGFRVAWMSTTLSKSQIALRLTRYNILPTHLRNILVEDRIAEIHDLCNTILKLEHLPDFLVIDNLEGLYRISNKGNAVYDRECACAALKDLAVQADISILLLSELRHTVDHRNTYLPRREDFYHWESIKRWIDNACVFYRGGYYEETNDNEVNAYLRVGPSSDRCCYFSMRWDRVKNRLVPTDYSFL
jgi:replicative DNA helicase